MRKTNLVVVGLSELEFGPEYVDVDDPFEVGKLGFEVPEQRLDPRLVGRGAGPPEVTPSWWSSCCATLKPDPGRGNRQQHVIEKRRRHTPDQIICKLAEGNKLLAGGTELDAVCRHLEIAESTWHRWVAQYGGLKANDAKRLKELESENGRLKKLVANQALDIDMLREVSKGNY